MKKALISLALLALLAPLAPAQFWGMSSGSGLPDPKNKTGQVLTSDGTIAKWAPMNVGQIAELSFGTCIGADCSTSSISTPSGWIAPYSGSMWACYAWAKTPPQGSSLTIDVKKNGTSILSTPITIPNGAPSVVISQDFSTIPTEFEETDLFTVVPTAVGSSTAGKDVSVLCRGYYSLPGDTGQTSAVYPSIFNSDWLSASWLDQASTTAQDRIAGFRISAPSASYYHQSLLYQQASYAGDVTVTAKVAFSDSKGGGYEGYAGAVLTNAEPTGTPHKYGLQYTTNNASPTYIQAICDGAENACSGASNGTLNIGTSIAWFRVSRVGTTLTSSYSIDGIHWTTRHTIDRPDLTTVHAGIFVFRRGTTSGTTNLDVLSWNVTAP